jgi:N-methylhydantoinase A/oxoprolinase/acetone carboxylase beta subunit
VVCKIAEAIGISKVLIPGLAAVFSAFGIGFSNIAHEFEAPLDDAQDDTRKAAEAKLLEQANRAMFAEGFDLDKCNIDTCIRLDGARSQLVLSVTKTIPRAHLSGSFSAAERREARVGGTRKTRVAGRWSELPLYRAADQVEAMSGTGPAVLEEAFFTCRVERGWNFEWGTHGDILLTKTHGASAS